MQRSLTAPTVTRIYNSYDLYNIQSALNIIQSQSQSQILRIVYTKTHHGGNGHDELIYNCVICLGFAIKSLAVEIFQ